MASPSQSHETLKRFTDAATQAVAKSISDFQREGERERELQRAQFAARMSELGYRLESIADLERRLTERLATLKGVGLSIEDVEPVLRELVSEVMAKHPVPKDGRSVTIDDVRPIIAEQVAEAVARLRDGHHPGDQNWAPQRGWPRNLHVIDVDAAPHPLVVERVTEAVKLLPRPRPTN